MITEDEAIRAIEELPEVTEGVKWGRRTWSAAGSKGFVWERPFSKADIKRFGDQPVPDGPIFAVRLADLGEKEALLGEGRPGHFTIQHFNGYPALLIQLSATSAEAFAETVLDGWLAAAPPEIAEQYVRDREK